MSGVATIEIYTFLHSTSDIKDIFNKKHLNFNFIIYNQFNMFNKERKI